MKELVKLWLWAKVANEILALSMMALSIGLAVWFIFFYLPGWMVTL